MRYFNRVQANSGGVSILAILVFTGIFFAALAGIPRWRLFTTTEELSAEQVEYSDNAQNCYCYDNFQEECGGFLDSYSNLVNHPRYLPGQVPPCILYQRTLHEESPVFSIILTINVQEEIIGETVQNILKFTEEPWEFIIVFDDTRDNSIHEVLAALHENGCIDPQNERIDYFYNNITGISSDIGAASCNKDLVRLLLINQETPVFETSANNIGMRAATGEFFLLLQDDQRPTALGWNTELAAPVRAFQDVVGVSARCAHDFLISKGEDMVGTDCEAEPVQKSKCQFFVRDTGNRGPLLLKADKVRILGYFDEQNLYLGNDEHDFFARAWFQYGWVAGWYHTSFEHLHSYGRSRKNIAEHEYEKTFKDSRYNRSNGGFLKQNVTYEQVSSHNAIRTIPESLCSTP